MQKHAACGLVATGTNSPVKKLMNSWLYYTLAIGLVAAGFVCWLTNLFSLPGNWALLGLTGLFAWLVPHDSSLGVTSNRRWILLVIAIVGEIIEFVAGAAGAAKQGPAADRPGSRSLAHSLAVFAAPSSVCRSLWSARPSPPYWAAPPALRRRVSRRNLG